MFNHVQSYTTWAYSWIGQSSLARDVSLNPNACGSVAATQRRDAVRRYLSTLGAGRNSRMLAATAGDELIRHEVNVTNTGNVDSAVAVLAFSTPPGAGVNGVPLKQLFGFEKVFLRVGATATVFFGMTARDLTLVDTDGDRYVGEGTWSLSVESLQTKLCV